MRRFWCLGTVVLGTGLFSAASGQTLPRDRAVDIASAYCAAVGCSLAGTPEVLFPASGEQYHQPVWRIRFPGQADVFVGDPSGVVTGYHDYALTRRLAHEPVGSPISEADAVARAKAALAATHCADDLVPLRAVCAGHGDSASVHYWSVIWRRVSGGIPYRADTVNVLIQAETGAVIGLGLAFPTPPPAAGIPKVTAADAAAAGFAQMAKSGMPDVVPLLLSMEIVRPNTLYVPGGNIRPVEGPSRVAWVSSFAVGQRTYYVYVDAEAGDVVGGDAAGPRGSDAIAPTLAQWLRSARSFEVYRRARSGAWPAHPIVVMSKTSNEQAFRRLRGAGESAVPPKRFGDIRIVLIGQEPARIDMAYCDGMMGLGSQWTAAPREVKRLIAALDQNTR